MSKPNILRVTQIVAVLFSITKLALDIFFVLNNYYSVHTALFGEKFQQDVLPTDIKMGLIIEALIISAPICIVATVNYTKTDMKQKRGVITVITSGLMFFADYLASTILHRTVLISLADKYGEKVISMISSINSVRSFTGVLSCTALVMICCCGAVEIYGGALKSAESPA
ncbi:hypothetical protein [Ruminococcus flavefaciens]|jgi:hypothetical protein|uniref:hypothetical protein n=1 Tax=Ruminococcus flavefaciens TaxID=1265 RepID=UPI0013DBA1A4|nr:hypothetical protein [Ruminococcus flavefaciens]